MMRVTWLSYTTCQYLKGFWIISKCVSMTEGYTTCCWIDLSSDNWNVLEDSTLYRRLVDALMHLANTGRPGKSFAVYYLACFVHKPRSGLWTAGKNIPRYLRIRNHWGFNIILRMTRYCRFSWMRAGGTRTQQGSPSVDKC